MDHLQECERRRAFSIWLRTGRLPSGRRADGIELKFNPWHDPENGRFTFAGTGRHYGAGRSAESRRRSGPRIEYGDDFSMPPIRSMEDADAWRLKELAEKGHLPGYREAIERRYQFYKSVLARRQGDVVQPLRRVDRSGGASDRQSAQSSTPGKSSGGFAGGGDFGGGGASDSWERPSESLSRRTETDPAPDSGAVPVALSDRPSQPEARASGQPVSAQWRKAERNGYLYEIDDQNRTRRVSGLIILSTDQGRSKTAQLSAGGSDRRTTDQGGHYIARRFNGPTEAFNHFAQDGSFNRSDYAKLENEWAKAKRLKKQVRVKIVPVFEGSSQRPSALNVWFWIDGKMRSKRLHNEPKEKKNAKQRD